MLLQEAGSAEFYNPKSLGKGKFRYAELLPKFISEVGKRTKTNLISLLDEKFNIMQNIENNVRGLNMDRRTRFGQLFGLDLLFFQQHAGEHSLQMTNAFSVMDTIKLKDSNGKQYDISRAYKVVVDSNGVGRLKLKDGLTKLDGSEWTTADEFALERKMIAINERMHGIYNKQDANAWQMTAIGRLGMMFKGWIVAPFMRRYRGRYWSQDLDSYQEGFYKTAYDFAVNYIKGLKDGQKSIVMNWKKLTNHEKANIKRFGIETAMFWTLASLAALVTAGDDDEPDSFLASMMKYQLFRLNTELGVYTPIGMVPEGLKMIQSPFAGINTLENIIGVIALASPTEWDQFTKEIERGRFKGKKQWYRTIVTSPLVPLNNTIYKSLHPEEGFLFYQD